MLTGGRILVAVVGAVVLAVVAVFVVRSVWWDTASKDGPLPTDVTTTQTVPTESESTSAQENPDDTTDGGMDGSDTTSTTTSDTTTSDTTSTDHTEPYTATTERIQRILGTVAVDVELPQVQGGDSGVATIFNEEMQTVLHHQADALTGGTLESRPGSGVHVGERVLSGLLRTVATNYLEGTSTALAGTVVVDTESGSVITLASLFSDEDTGLQKLQELTEQLGPESNADFDTSKLEPTEQVFGQWTAESDGMRLYFAEGLVAPESAGIVELAIPWDDLDEVLKPGVAQIVSS